MVPVGWVGWEGLCRLQGNIYLMHFRTSLARLVWAPAQAQVQVQVMGLAGQGSGWVG
jgi:hypothetical protein